MGELIVRLSDEDVARIAAALAEMLEPKLKPTHIHLNVDRQEIAKAVTKASDWQMTP